MTKRVILINAGNNYPRAEWNLLVSPPLGILALGSYLTAHDVPVELIDVQVDFGFGLTSGIERLICQRVVRYLQGQADAIAWIGISQLSNVASGVLLAQEIHTALPEIPIVFGGYFPSNNYRLLLEKYPFITAIVRGDGEAAALQISHSLAQGQPFLCDQTPNLAWQDGGEIHTTPVQPIALDNLPILDFRLLRNRFCYQLANTITSRGCPFRCNYCLENDMRSYATYPIAWVDQQLDHLEAELPNKYVLIGDPTFGLGRKRTLELCQVMRGRRFKYGMGSRVDVLTPDLIPPLCQAGLEFAYWGIESASPATLLRMNKVRSEAEVESYLKKALEVLKVCFENNLVPFLSLMLGFPGESETDLQATLEFVKEVRRLHSQIAAQTGVETGFSLALNPPKIYGGSPLAERVAKDFPNAVLCTLFDGERMVDSPSPGLGQDIVRRYGVEIISHGYYTPKVSELIDHYYLFSVKDFVAAHPELTDEQGVTVFCDNLRRFPDLTTPLC